eukprot:SAG31_NODE_37037_length_308_cov_0.636364_1_plen_44_part_10
MLPTVLKYLAHAEVIVLSYETHFIIRWRMAAHCERVTGHWGRTG